MVRSWLLCSSLLLLSFPARSANAPITVEEIDLPIREVTIFSDRARIVRRGDIRLAKGQSTVTLPRLPATADSESVRVEATGARLLRVSVRKVSHDAIPKTEAQKLIDRLTTLRDEEAALTDRRDTLQNEQRFLDSIRPHGEPQGADKLPPLLLNASGWPAALEFLDVRRGTVDKALAEVAERIRSKEKEITTAQTEANQLLGQGGDDSGFLVDAVVEGTGATVHLSLSYLAEGARWYPAYDVRYTPGTNSVEMGFSGLVSQETGENWTDAKLILSSAVPTTVTNIPTVAVWKIGDQERFIPIPEAGPQDGASVPLDRSGQSASETDSDQDGEDGDQDDLREQLQAAAGDRDEDGTPKGDESDGEGRGAKSEDKTIAPTPTAQELTLGVGTQKTLTIAGTIKQMAVGSPEISDAKTIGPSEVALLGVAEGQTTLLVWLQNGTRLSYLVKVRKRDAGGISTEVRRLLGDMEGVSVRIVGDRVFVEGTPLTTEDADRLKKVIELFPDVKDVTQPNGKFLVANRSKVKKTPGTDKSPEQIAPRGPGPAGKDISFEVPSGWTPPPLEVDLPATLAGGYEFTFGAVQAETIRTGAEARRVPLFTETSPAETWIKILPALSHSAYLVAEVTNSGSTPWLQGQAHLFVGNDLVGDAVVPTTAPGEKVTMPLGIDDAIKVDRNVQVVSTERGVFSKQDVSAYQIVIELLNTRRTPLPVRVFDQIALPHQKEVEVLLTKTDPPQFKDEKALNEEGNLEWRTELGVGEKRSLSFTYEVTRPKGWKLWQTSTPAASQ